MRRNRQLQHLFSYFQSKLLNPNSPNDLRAWCYNWRHVGYTLLWFFSCKKQEARSDEAIPRDKVWIRSYCKKDGPTSSCVSSELEMIREASKTQTSECSEDLLNDTLTSVFGMDDRGRVRAIGTTVSRSQVLGAIPAISKMNKKVIQYENLQKEWKEYKGHLDRSMDEVRAMYQKILDNQNSTYQTQYSSSAAQHSCGKQLGEKESAT